MSPDVDTIAADVVRVDASMSPSPQPTPRTPLLFVGESPPSGSPADFTPFDCDSGDRLARLLGLRDRDTLLAHTRRANIFDAPTGVGPSTPSWSDARARENADDIARTLAPRVLVTLGQRVAHAFGVSPDVHYVPHRIAIDVRTSDVAHLAPTCDVIVAPHPSGRSAKLKNALDRREFRRALLVDLVHAAPRLTPLDFALTPSAARMRTDVAAAREILVDLAHVVCPTDPRAGACALRFIVTSLNSIDHQPVRALTEWFAQSSTPLEALRGLITVQATRRAWGLSNRQDTPGDDLSRAVVLEPTFARACALRWRELRG